MQDATPAAHADISHPPVVTLATTMTTTMNNISPAEEEAQRTWVHAKVLLQQVRYVS